MSRVQPTGSADFAAGFAYVLRDWEAGIPWEQSVDLATTPANQRSHAFTSGARAAANAFEGATDEVYRVARHFGLPQSRIEELIESARESARQGRGYRRKPSHATKTEAVIEGRDDARRFGRDGFQFGRTKAQTRAAARDDFGVKSAFFLDAVDEGWEDARRERSAWGETWSPDTPYGRGSGHATKKKLPSAQLEREIREALSGPRHATEKHGHPGAYLPLNIGERSRFTAHGKPFIVSYHSRGTFTLATDPPGERRRWGTRDQIMRDVQYAFDHGELPPASGERW